MTKERIWEFALAQSAIDCNCRPEDFLSEQGRVVPSAAHPQARKYLELPYECDLVSYGPCVIAQTSPRIAPIAEEYIHRYPAVHLFETPHLHALDDMLSPYDLKVCYMAEYFLPEPADMRSLSCPYPMRLMGPEDFAPLYASESWQNALCEKRKELDAIGVGAFDGDRLIGLAGASADCESMYQIGVDVLPEYRRQGVAAALTSRLAQEIMRLDKVPFYCAAWCNIASVRNAVKCGFHPAWIEMTARDKAHVEQMNGR